MAKNGPERAKNDCLGSKNGEKGDMDLASTLSPPLLPLWTKSTKYYLTGS